MHNTLLIELARQRQAELIAEASKRSRARLVARPRVPKQRGLAARVRHLTRAVYLPDRPALHRP